MRKFIDIIVEGQISEAPIGDFETHNWDQKGSFDQSGMGNEKRVIPALGKILRRRFEKNNNIFNLHFVNLTDEELMRILDEVGSEPWVKNQKSHELKYEYLTNHLGGELSSDQLAILGVPDVKPDPNGITFVFWSHSVAIDPISPWMMIHRCMHFIEDGKERGYLNEQSEALIAEIHATVDDQNNYRSIIPYLMMRSARNQNLDMDEITIEMMTEYVFFNKIRLKDEATPRAKELVKDIEKLVASLLRSCHGRIFGGF